MKGLYLHNYYTNDVDKLDKFLFDKGMEKLRKLFFIKAVTVLQKIVLDHWYKPNGKLEGTKTVVQRVTASNWYTGNWLNLNQRYAHPSGVWTAKIFANDNYLGANKFLLAGIVTKSIRHSG